MKKLLLLPLLMSLAFISACTAKTYDIVVTLFPQYDMVKAIIGDKDLSVTMILKPGVEAHDFEPTSKQLGLIKNSKLFIYTSDDLETWAKDLVNKGQVVNLEALTEEIHEHAHPEEAHHEHEHDHDHDHDVHYWVSIHTQVHMVEAVLETIIELDPENQAYYEANALVLINQLKALRAQYKAFEAYEDVPVYFVGHNVFSSLNEEFHMNIISLTDQFSPEADPTSAQIGLMIDQIFASKSLYVYFDPFENDAIAKTIQNDLKTRYNHIVTLLPLHSMHNMSKSQFDQGITLVDLWTENYNNLKLSFEMES